MAKNMARIILTDVLTEGNYSKMISERKINADSDFTAANDLLKIKSSSTDAICFHCQQAVEKYF